MMVRDLEDSTGDPLAGVLKRRIRRAAARRRCKAFMRAQGVMKGTSTEIATVCEGLRQPPPEPAPAFGID